MEKSSVNLSGLGEGQRPLPADQFCPQALLSPALRAGAVAPRWPRGSLHMFELLRGETVSSSDRQTPLPRTGLGRSLDSL